MNVTIISKTKKGKKYLEKDAAQLQGNFFIRALIESVKYNDGTRELHFKARAVKALDKAKVNPIDAFLNQIHADMKKEGLTDKDYVMAVKE